MDDRIHFIEHKGKQILLLDFSHANAHQMQLLLEYVRITVAKHARESLLTLADLTGATVDHAVATTAPARPRSALRRRGSSV